MNSESTQANLNPEAWAAAQVEEVAKDLEKQQRRMKRASQDRGVFFWWRPNGEVIGPKHVCAERGCHAGKGKLCRACAKQQGAAAPIRCAFAKGCEHDGEKRGEWYVLWYDTDRRRHRECGGTRAAALDLYRRRRTEVRQGKHFPESMKRAQKASLKTICADYVEKLRTNGKDRREQAKQRLAEIVAILGDKAAKVITPQDVERLKARLLASPARGRKDPDDPEKERTRTPASVNRYLQDLRAVYNLARINGKAEKNPVRDVRLLRENNKRVREITAEEEAAILGALDPTQRRTKAGRQDRRYRTDLRPLVRFLLETGLRAGEAVNLRWRDIDWTAGVATLRQTKAGVIQHAPLSSEALTILRALDPKLEGDYSGNPVFGWSDTRPWTVGYATHAFRDAVVSAGVKDLHLHDLRHSAACRWLRAGVDIYTVSKLLRHASVIMSERYAHLTQGDLRTAVNRATASNTASEQK
ncbi:MAG: site-specific integrase [Candidatus Methylomirabilota bacterium]